MQVRDCMNTHLICITPEESVAVAARFMARHNIGVLPVRARDGSLCGIVTDRDLVLRCMALNRSAEETSVAQIMSTGVTAVAPDAGLTQAAAAMAKQQVRRLPVVEGRRLVGMVSLGDLSRCEDYTMEAAEALSEITANVRRMG